MHFPLSHAQVGGFSVQSSELTFVRQSGRPRGKNGTARKKLGTARFDGPECFETPDSTARDSGRPGRLQARPPIKLERESGCKSYEGEGGLMLFQPRYPIQSVT